MIPMVVGVEGGKQTQNSGKNLWSCGQCNVQEPMGINQDPPILGLMTKSRDMTAMHYTLSADY